MNTQLENNGIKGYVLFYRVADFIISSLKEDLSDAGIIVFEEDDPDNAIKRIEQEQIDMVLTDFEPKDDELISFLKLIKKKYPTINRVALSEQIHRDDIIQLLLKGLITSYFEKPGGLEVLLNSFLHILFARKTLKSQKLLDLLGTVDGLPSFPQTYQELTDAIEREVSLKEIARVIEKDISITTQVLRLANSDFFRSGRFGSIERACIYLGLDTIKNIVFTVSLSSLKKMSAIQKKHLEKIIYHSVQVNQNFLKLYETQKGEKISDQYATIGITHDIGKIIMLQYLPGRFEKVIKYQKKNPDIGFYRSELELGFEGQTHAEIGAYFLNLWNFPEASVYTALFHHSTEDFAEPYKDILDIFAIVNELVYTTKND
jgi:HD-like signal output (HDOD) protein